MARHVLTLNGDDFRSRFMRNKKGLFKVVLGILFAGLLTAGDCDFQADVDDDDVDIDLKSIVES
jgi:hypothetical protein